MKIDLKNNSTLWGLVLIALGAFLLLQVTGLFGVLSDLFWSVAFAAAGAVFLYVFFTGLHTRWWAAIPGFTLLGLAATIFYGRFAPPFLSDITGAVFLASIGVGFLAIFLTNPQLWWALIPGGALLSLAGVVTVTNMGSFINPATVLFVGLGVTFGVIGLLSTYLQTNLRWAYIPAGVLLVLGLVVVTPFGGAFAPVWPLLLIAGGAYLVLRHASRSRQLPTPPPPAPTAFVPPAASNPGNGVNTQPQVVDAAATASATKERVPA